MAVTVIKAVEATLLAVVAVLALVTFLATVFTGRANDGAGLLTMCY